jgi:arylsulfatase
MVQNATGMDVWRKPFETLRAPLILDLRSDPTERGQQGIGYNDWWYRHAFYAVPTQRIVGNFLASFKEFPPRQRPGSFTINKALEELSNPPSGSH